MKELKKEIHPEIIRRYKVQREYFIPAKIALKNAKIAPVNCEIIVINHK